MIALLAIAGSDSAGAGQVSESAMSEDEQRMHERLVALTEGAGSVSDLHIEFMDGSMVSHRSVHIEAGELVSKEWKSPGSPMIHLEGRVTDARVSELLRRLIAEQYWTFQGTRFVPDAPTFLFRFYYGDLKYVDFSCDAAEFQDSPARTRIRDLFVRFLSDTELTSVPATP